MKNINIIFFLLFLLPQLAFSQAGQVDTTFNPEDVESGDGLGVNFDGYANYISKQIDGKLIVTGIIKSFNGNAVYEARGMLTQFGIYILDDNCTQGSRLAGSKKNELNNLLEIKELNQKITVYPNPNNGQFTIDLSNLNEIKSIAIYTINGNLLKELPIDKKQELQGLTTGTYTLILKLNNGKTAVKKIVVQ